MSQKLSPSWLKRFVLVPQNIKIGERIVGPQVPVFIVAEIGINHNGDMNLAIKMMEAAAEAKVDSVKFQNYRTEDFLTDKSLTYKYSQNGTEVVESQFEMFKRLELTDENVRELKKQADRLGLIFHSTPTSNAGVDVLVNEGVTVLKNGSDFLTNTDLLTYMAQSSLPVVIATGMAVEDEIAIAVNAIRKAKPKHNKSDNLIVLHCTSAYPTPPEEVNLKKITTIASQFDCLVGLSDHSEGNSAAMGAVALGACWIEKHFTLDKSLPGPDHRFSCDLTEMKSLVNSVREIEVLLGSSELSPSPSEELARTQYRLSCAAAKELPAGHILQDIDIAFRRPATGIPPSSRASLLGKRLKKDIKSFELFDIGDLS